MHEVVDAVLELDGRDDVRAIVLTGRGARAFAAGADIREMAALDARQVRAMCLLCVVVARLDAGGSGRVPCCC
jgi:enoyl-CoA hydratase/carnithine racemase